MELERAKKEVEEYLERDCSYPYALMIEGKWGSGKTYFIKNVIESYIGNPKKLRGIYVSLYGLTSAKAIDVALLNAIARVNYGENTLPIATIVADRTAQFIGKFISARFCEQQEENNQYKTFSDESYFFVFDDLERCSMPLNEVMGYLSTFVEQYAAKVILIGSEEEIERNFSRLPEFYAIALDSSIDWSEISEKPDPLQSMNLVQKKDQSQLTLSKVDKRLELVGKRFHSFSEVKEKVVGQTIHLTLSDSDQLLNILRSGEKENWFENIWKTDEDQRTIANECRNILNTLNHENLRTLQFAVDVFRHFLGLFPDEVKNGDVYSEFCRRWFSVVLEVSCYFKKGFADIDWTNKEEISSVTFLSHESVWKRMETDFTSIKVVHDYIFRSENSSEKVADSARKYYDIVKRAHLDETDPMRSLLSFYMMNDSDVKKWIDAVLKRLSEGGYRPEQYHEVLSILCQLEAIGFSIDLQCCVDQMKEGLKQGGKLFLVPGGQAEFIKKLTNHEGRDTFIQLIDELMKEENSEQAGSANEIRKIVCQPGWGRVLRDRVIERYNKTGIPMESVIEEMSADEWIHAIFDHESTEDDINCFRMIVLSNHSRSLSDSAKEILRSIQVQVREKLNSGQSFGKIFTLQLKYLIDNIDERIGA